MTGQFLVGGAVNAAALCLVAFLLSRFAGEVYGRALLAIFLFIAGGAYVGFAVAGGASGAWVLLEFLQAIALGALGLLGMRGSTAWLALGWAVHPLWDAILHSLGAGREFAPQPWAISCITFDLVVAAYLALAYGRGWVAGRTPGATGEVSHTPAPSAPASR